MGKEEKTAIHAVEAQGRQYTDEQMIKIMIDKMFSTFVQKASCDIGVTFNGKIKGKTGSFPKQNAVAVFNQMKKRKEVRIMVENRIRTDYFRLSSIITKEGREGRVQVFTDVQGMPVTDEELAELRRLQKETAAKVDEILNR